jgi:hypothetical protein
MHYSKNTNKLFFRKYVYKIAIRTPVAGIFRGKNLKIARLEVALLEDRLKKNGGKHVGVGGYNKSWASKNDLDLANNLIDILEKLEDYRLRVESNTLGLYSNDDNFISDVQRTGSQIEEISRPSSDKIKHFLLSSPSAIIRKEYTHKYKVTAKPLWKEAENFIKWAEKLPKIKITSNNYIYGGYFYVADEKTLSMCRIFLSDKIQKVEELVKEQEF